jgi:hypothetical protein
LCFLVLACKKNIQTGLNDICESFSKSDPNIPFQHWLLLLVLKHLACTTIMESIMVIPQKAKNRTAIKSSDIAPGHISKGT